MTASNFSSKLHNNPYKIKRFPLKPTQRHSISILLVLNIFKKAEIFTIWYTYNYYFLAQLCKPIHMYIF